MLLYNKALDVNHTLLRMAALIVLIGKKDVEQERLRILDFVLSNPVHISEMKLGKDLIKERNRFKEFENRYQKFDPRNLFDTMAPIQDAVFAKLIELKAIEQNEETNRFELNPKALPNELFKILDDDDSSISKKTISFLSEYLVELNLIGDNGLKRASQLMEYRYDAA